MTKPRPELAFIRRRIQQALKVHSVGLMPRCVDALVETMMEMVLIDRRTSAAMVEAARSRMAPGDETYFDIVCRGIAERIEHYPGEMDSMEFPPPDEDDEPTSPGRPKPRGAA